MQNLNETGLNIYTQSKPDVCFVQGFFEEIEDLKYALQQAARLNTAYEKALKKLCLQSGMPFPKITATTPKQHQRKRTRSKAREFKLQ